MSTTKGSLRADQYTISNLIQNQAPVGWAHWESLLESAQKQEKPNQ